MSALDIACRALRVTRRAAGPLAWLYALNVGTTLLAGLLLRGQLSRVFRPAHPPVDLLGWVFVLRREPGLAGALGQSLGGALLLYWILSSGLFAALLAQLARVSHPLPAAAERGETSGLGRRPLGSQLRRSAWRIAVLRLMVLLAQIATLGGWLVSARGLYRAALHWPDERWLIATQTVLALPFASLIGLLALLSHYAQPLLVARQRGLWQALGETMGRLRRHPLALLGLWLVYLALIGASTATVLRLQRALPGAPATAAIAQLAVAFKGLTLLWAWSCALEVDRLTARPRRSAPGVRTARSAAAFRRG